MPSVSLWLIHNKLQNPSRRAFAARIGFTGESNLGRVHFRLKVRGKHHRARIMQTAAVAVIQIHCLPRAAINAHFQHPRIRPGQNVNAERSAFEFYSRFPARLRCRQQFFAAERIRSTTSRYKAESRLPLPVSGLRT